MTLHDRIINLRKSQYWADEFSNGYDQAKFESSKLAKEADELMAEMATHILELIDAIETDEVIYESIVVRHLATETVDRYKANKEINQ